MSFTGQVLQPLNHVSQIFDRGLKNVARGSDGHLYLVRWRRSTARATQGLEIELNCDELVDQARHQTPIIRNPHFLARLFRHAPLRPLAFRVSDVAARMLVTRTQHKKLQKR